MREYSGGGIMKTKMKKYSFFLTLGMFAMCSMQASFAATTVAESTPKGFSVDPAAVALFDRAAKLYGGCKTIRLRWKTPGTSVFGEDATQFFTVVFARPNRLKVLFENGEDLRELDLVDGKNHWSMQYDTLPAKTTFGATYSKEPFEKGKVAQGDIFRFLYAAQGFGDAFSELLKGEHEIQSAKIKEMRDPKQKVEYFEAKKLTPALWKGREWERVQINYRYGPNDGWPALSYAKIYWFARTLLHEWSRTRAVVNV